jgi:hypothetical protein
LEPVASAAPRGTAFHTNCSPSPTYSPRGSQAFVKVEGVRRFDLPCHRCCVCTHRKEPRVQHRWRVHGASAHAVAIERDDRRGLGRRLTTRVWAPVEARGALVGHALCLRFRVVSVRLETGAVRPALVGLTALAGAVVVRSDDHARISATCGVRAGIGAVAVFGPTHGVRARGGGAHGLDIRLQAILTVSGHAAFARAVVRRRHPLGV